MIDWNAPRADEKRLRLEDYTLDFIPDCVRRVQETSGVEDVNIIGYCMGGVLSTIYAALHADGPLKHLVCFTTPIDWKQMPLFQAWSDRRYFDVDRLVDCGRQRAGGFHPVRRSTCCALPAASPASCGSGTTCGMTSSSSPSACSTAGATETLPLAGEYFRQTTKELLWDNKLCRGELVRGRPPCRSQEHHRAHPARGGRA